MAPDVPAEPAPVGPARPSLHYTPQRNWMNDPNGLVFHNGRYHLFYQYNPHGSDHRNMSWGHASSPDLLAWDEHPVAIPFDEHEQVYSGSIVADPENTSGFGRDGITPLVAIYTSEYGIQAQSLAYSLDDGLTWTKYEGNPVLDRGSAHFRDPKVFRYGTGPDACWLMVAVEAHERRVLLHRSTDLKNWEYLSAYGPAGPVSGVWECPDLFPLAVDGNPDDVRWVMIISLAEGSAAGGSGTHYVVGTFDGVTFTPDVAVDEIAKDDPRLGDLDWVDGGRDCYAGVTFNGLDDSDRTFIAWMSNWDYARSIPTDPWRGAMTLARRLSLVTVDGRPQLRSVPVLPEGTVVEQRTETIEDGKAIASVLPVAARIDLTARLDDGGDLVAWVAGGDRAERVVVRYTGGTLSVDRTAAAAELPPTFESVETIALPGDGVAVDLSIVIDEGSVEVFAANGLRCITDLVFLGAGQRHLTVEAVGGPVTVENLTIRDLA